VAFHAVLRAAAEAYRLEADTRVPDVPFHGHAVLVWATRRGPTVIALGSDGSRQASLGLSRDPFEVRRRRLPLRQAAASPHAATLAILTKCGGPTGATWNLARPLRRPDDVQFKYVSCMAR
jgi:hypothetical protein